MTSNSLTPIINSITALLSTAAGRPILIALDGRCGSGKTTLAAQLAERFPGSRTIHTDDYSRLSSGCRGGKHSPAPTWI